MNLARSLDYINSYNKAISRDHSFHFRLFSYIIYIPYHMIFCIVLCKLCSLERHWQVYNAKVFITKSITQTRGLIVKGSPDLSHFICEINVGKKRIRNRTTMNLNDLIFSRFSVDLEIQFQSRSISDRPLSDIDFKNKMAWVLTILKFNSSGLFGPDRVDRC